MLVFFFFFQAEDGIRDHCVTGVQTCALPISVGDDKVFYGRLDGVVVALNAATGAVAWKNTVVDFRDRFAINNAPQFVDGRSEERRVGKSVGCGGRRMNRRKKRESRWITR